jgi:hypothetical protein
MYWDLGGVVWARLSRVDYLELGGGEI